MIEISKREVVAAVATFATLKTGLAVLGFMGTIGFTSFVLEEAEQTCMFGNFGLSKKEELAKMSIRHINQCFYLHDTADAWNNTLGYLYPFSFAYRNYQVANQLNLCSSLYSALKKRGKNLNDAGELGARCKIAYSTKRINESMGVQADNTEPEFSKRLGNALD